MADIPKIKQRIYKDINAGRFGHATGLLEKTVRKSIADYELWFLHGAVNGQLGNYDIAVKSLQKAISLNPSHLESFANLGLAYIRLERYVQAIETYLALLDKSPTYSGAHFHLGYAYLAAGDIEGALTSLKEAIRLQPNNIESYVFVK